MLDPATEGVMGLSEPVQAAVPRAVELVESLIASALRDVGEQISRLNRRMAEDYSEPKMSWLNIQNRLR